MRKHRQDRWVLLLTLVLLAAGSVVIFGIGPRVAETQGLGDSYHYVKHHALFVVVGIVAMAIFAFDWRKLLKKFFGDKYKGNYDFLVKISGVATLIAFALCFLVPVLGWMGASNIVSGTGGAYRRFKFPGIGEFQIVELLKLCLIFYVPMIIKKRKDEGLLGTKSFWVPIVTIIAATLIIVSGMQKDLGSTVVIIAMIFCMLLVAKVPSWQILTLLGVLFLGLVVMIISQPHRIQRIAGWSGEGDDYHLENSLIGIGTGGMFGVGLGNSIQSAGYLPEAMSDSIFSVICESWGLLGAMLIISAFILLFLNIIKVARHTADLDQKLTVIGVFAWIFAHVIINVLGMIGVIPMKGITLSFLSYGGASLVFTCAAIGVVLQISGWTRREVVDEDLSSGRGQRGTRYAGYRRRS